MNVWLSLNKALSLFSQKSAIIDGEKRFTYAEFGDRVARLAAVLLGLGLKKGDVAAISAPNCHQYMEVYYACAVTGIVLCPINYRLAVPEIAAILDDSKAKALFIHSDFESCLKEIRESYSSLKTLVSFGPIPVPETTDFETLLKHSSPLDLSELPQLNAEDLAQLYYTSGTTGRPKGVMLSQGNITFNALAVIADLRLFENDTWLHAAPMFHLADAWATFAITWVGATHVFIPYFQPRQALQQIDRESVSATVLVPTMLNAMLNDPEADNFNYESLRLILTGGSPIAPELVRWAVTKYNCEYVQLYGMTETSPFLTLSRPKLAQLQDGSNKELEVRARTGRGYIGAEVKVVRADGVQVAADDLEVGEIIARGPTIFGGYLNQPEATAATIRNGWIHTGDLATIDIEGSINIVDRAKDMIITGGENVYSTEVEYVLHEHPGVLECAVFGIPHEFWGEAVKAVVVQKLGHEITEIQLTDFLKQRLANYKIPKSFDFVDALPKTGSGKIYKKGLREEYWRSCEKQVH